MALNIPANFRNDIQGRDAALVPIVRIGNQADADYIFISTNAGIIGGESFLPLLLNIPSLKESIDIEKRNYKISAVNLDISNFPYDGQRFSELVGDSSLINTECRIWWASPSGNIPYTDPSGVDADSAMQIYFGTIRRYTHDDEKVRLVVEDRSQATLHKDLPLDNLGTGDEVPDKYKNKPIPMVYGHVDRSPCVVISPLTEGELSYNEENLTIQVDSIPVDLTDTRLYIHDDYYYKLAKTQDYGIFGLQNIYAGGELYTHLNTDNKIILKLSEGGNLTALAENNAHVKIEPKIQIMSVSADTTDAVINDSGGHGFVEGTGLTSDLSISGINNFINNSGSLNINGKTFWIASGYTYAQSIVISFSIKPIPTNIINRDIFRDNGLPVKPIWTTINPTGTIVATKYIGDVSGSDGHLFANISTYDMGDKNFTMYFVKTAQQGEYTFSNFTSISPETFSVLGGFTQDELIDPEAVIPNNLLVSIGVSDNPQIIDLDIVLNKFDITYEIFIQDVFKSHFYANVNGRAMVFLSNLYFSPTVPLVIAHILENELGQGTITLPDASDISVGSIYDWSYSFTVDKKINSKKLIEGIASASPYIPRFDNMGNFKFDIIPRDGGIIDHTIKEAEVIDFSFSRTKIEDVCTKVIFKYNWDYARGEFNDSVTADIEDILEGYDFDYYGFPAVTYDGDGNSIHLESTVTIDDDRGKYIRKYDLINTAQDFADWYLLWNANQHLKMKVKLPLKYMNLEIGDFIDFDAILGEVKPYGINYIEDGEVNGQEVFKNFLITSTNKTLEWIEFFCVQMHGLDTSGGLYAGTQGCNDPESCNYDADADDASGCKYNDCTYDPSDDSTWEGACGGSAKIDCCGVCNGNAICDGCGDCGVEGELDECGVCNGDNSSCADCDGVPNGLKIINDCGDCVIEGDATDILCIKGCDGIWKNDGTHLIVDECEICGGDNSSCLICPEDGIVTLWGVDYDVATTTEINLTNSGLTGIIPPEIGCLTNLTYLMLYNNALTGEIPSSIGDLTNLTFLVLSKNQLEGTIPSSIGNLNLVADLGLNDNQLTGSIPPEIGNMTSLTSVAFSTNQFSGEIPPEIGNLTNLEYISAHINQFSGEIPPEICNQGDITRHFWDNKLCPQMFGTDNESYPYCLSDSDVGTQDTSGCEEYGLIGDVNGDGDSNILDIVALVNCILTIADGGTCPPQGDVNDSGDFNILDIVNLANCILEGNCGG